MSRLIDADKLIEILEENNQKLQEQIRDAREYLQKEVYEAQYFTVVDIVKLIKEQPTAYDVDKVIKQLEERLFSAEVYNDDLDGCDINDLLCMGDVIEIVEAGVLDENIWI